MPTTNMGIINFDDLRFPEFLVEGDEFVKLQTQVSLLNQRIEALEELLLEFGIKKVFDKTDNQE